MPRNKNRLNNRMLRNIRKEDVYQGIITDLVLSGAIARDKGEALLGYEIPDYLTLDAVVVAKPVEAKTTKATKAKADAEDEE